MKQKRHPIKNLKAFATVPSQWVLEVCQVSAVPHWDTERWTLLQCYLVVRFFFFLFGATFYLAKYLIKSLNFINFTGIFNFVLTLLKIPVCLLICAPILSLAELLLGKKLHPLKFSDGWKGIQARGERWVLMGTFAMRSAEAHSPNHYLFAVMCKKSNTKVLFSKFFCQVLNLPKGHWLGCALSDVSFCHQNVHHLI